jgi:RimJ/RimL family protein N-acetyltransferase
MPPLTTRRLALRLVEAADAPALAALMTLEVSRWLANWPSPLTEEAALARIALLRAGAAKHQLYPYAILTNETVIGLATIGRDTANPTHGELGYWLGVPFQGQGYMREALAAIFQAAFEAQNFTCLEAGAQPENLASLATLRACGMTPIGTRLVFAPTRNREELCHFFAVKNQQVELQAGSTSTLQN